MLSAMSVKLLEDFQSHYWKSYRILRGMFFDYPLEYDIGEEAFREKVVKVLPNQEPLKILGIGSGQGGLECIHMRRMLTRVSRIENTVVEPSMGAMEVYKSLISEDLSKRVNTSWYQETFQQYQKRRQSTSATNKFHFISSVHSLYYVDKDGSGIEYLTDLLEKGGVLFIVIHTDNSGAIKFYRKIEESYGPTFRRSTLHHYVTSKVVKLLDIDDRVTYDIVKNHSKLDVTPCFNDESFEGSLMLDFMTHIVDFKSTISRDVLNSHLDYLKTLDCAETLSDGKIIFHVDWDTIIIKKK